MNIWTDIESEERIYLSGSDKRSDRRTGVRRAEGFHTVNLIRVNGDKEIFKDDIGGTRVRRETKRLRFELEIRFNWEAIDVMFYCYEAVLLHFFFHVSFFTFQEQPDEEKFLV